MGLIQHARRSATSCEMAEAILKVNTRVKDVTAASLGPEYCLTTYSLTIKLPSIDIECYDSHSSNTGTGLYRFGRHEEDV